MLPSYGNPYKNSESCETGGLKWLKLMRLTLTVTIAVVKKLGRITCQLAVLFSDVNVLSFRFFKKNDHFLEDPCSNFTVCIQSLLNLS